MDHLQAMRVFVRVVEAGSFTRAADSLGLPKATVTKQIQALESRLRTRLLNRTTRRVSVTPDGAAYYERAARLLGDFDDIEASMINAQAAPRGRLRIDVTTSVARLVIMPGLSTFLARYPDIEIELGVSDRIVDLIGDNIDVVLRAGTITDQSLVARRIGLLRFVTVASPAYLARYGTPAEPAELERRRHSVVGYFTPGVRRHFPLVFERGGEQVEVAGHSRIAINEGSAHLSAILAGYGVSQTLSFVAEPHLASGELVALMPEWSRPAIPIYVVYPPNRHLSAKVRVFVDWVAELFASDPRLRIADPGAGVAAMSAAMSDGRAVGRRRQADARDGAGVDGLVVDGPVITGGVLDGTALDAARLRGAALDGAAPDGIAVDGAPVLDGTAPGPDATLRS